LNLPTNKKIPPLSDACDDSDEYVRNKKNGYWQDFCGEVKKIKINFKNCLLVLGRKLEKLFLSVQSDKCDWLYTMLISISRVRQKIRPDRHTPRQSRQPINKWKSSNGRKVTYA